MRHIDKKSLFQLSAFSFQLSAVKLLILGMTLAVSGFWFAGCGYTTRSMISNKFRSIYIASFTSKIDITREADTGNKYKIYRPYLETDITKTVINKFLLDGNLKVVKEGAADLVLKGELVEFRKDPLRYSDSDEVEEYRVNLMVDIILWDNKDNKLVWEEKGFTGDTSYFTTGASAKSESLAINEAITDLSRRIVERTVEQW